jgi:phage shock protein PspC (stress-responsive transcriptional regulator)
MTTNEPSKPEHGSSRPPMWVERSRTDRILGGVCAGIARSVGVDPVLVRIGVVLLGLVSGGAAVLAYLLAWVLLPQAAGEPQGRPRVVSPPSAGGAKEAWTAVGGELRSLATELRPKQPSGEAAQPEATQPEATQPEATQPEATQPEATPGPNRRPSLRSVDAALTGFGDRLRDPEVQQGARRTLAGLSAAVDASVEELGSRVRRGRTGPEGSPPSRPDAPRKQP